MQAGAPDIQLVLTRLSGNPDLFASFTAPTDAAPVPTDAAATHPDPEPNPNPNRNPNPDPDPDATQLPTDAASCVAPTCWSSTDAEGQL